MTALRVFTDIHCHLLPGIDDGAATLNDSLQMAQLAVADGIKTIICTPHQLGNYDNPGDDIRRRTQELQQTLRQRQIPLRVLPGGDVRIEPDMTKKIVRGEVMTLGDHRLHVLLELPHELYFPLEPVLAQLRRGKMVGILSHPERNQGIQQNPSLLEPLVRQGCLMQVTADSLIGKFGGGCQQLSQWMLEQGLVHFLASDAHDLKRRRPKMSKAMAAAAEIAGEDVAADLCCHNPAAVAEGNTVEGGVRARVRKSWGLMRWLRQAS